MSDSLEMDVTATVVNVDSRLVSNGTKTIWEVETQDGTKWATFRADIGNAAIACKGQLADLKVSIQKNGNFTNHYLNQIKLNPNAAQTPVGAAVLNAQAVQTQKVEEVTFDTYKANEDTREARKQESIHRQVAAKVAAQVASEGDTAGIFWQNVKELVDFFQRGVTPIDGTPPEEAVQTSVTSHAAEAAQADEIPF